MEENKTKIVEMTSEEIAQYEAYKEKQAKTTAKLKAKADREAYKELVDEAIERNIPMLATVGERLRETKANVIRDFNQVIEMKSEVLNLVKDDQRSNTFTNSNGNMRICLGVYTTDGYRDTVEDGIAIVKEYIEGLANDEKTKALVAMVMRLLARDAKGTLKASRVMQLRKIADELDDERFLEGVAIIEESYQPAISRQFIKAEVKNEFGAWVGVPLGMTEA